MTRLVLEAIRAASTTSTFVSRQAIREVVGVGARDLDLALTGLVNDGLVIQDAPDEFRAPPEGEGEDAPSDAVSAGDEADEPEQVEFFAAAEKIRALAAGERVVESPLDPAERSLPGEFAFAQLSPPKPPVVIRMPMTVARKLEVSVLGMVVGTGLSDAEGKGVGFVFEVQA